MESSWMANPNTTIYNYNNVTSMEYPAKSGPLEIAYRVIISVMLAIIMLAMGCSITIKDVRTHKSEPKGPLIGILSQFIMMPAVAFGLAHALHLLPHHAIGMIIVSSCPGGNTSNFLTLFSKGNLSLSICMTMLSSVLALGFMPLNMFIYLRSWTDQQAKIPFVQITITIILTWIPVMIGLFINNRYKKAAGYIFKVGSITGISMIVVVGIIQGELYPEFFDLDWNVWFGAFAQPVVGFLLGFLLATLARLEYDKRRAVAFETGIQNTGLALTVITVGFDGVRRNLYSQYPLLYGAGQVVTGAAITIPHFIYFCVKNMHEQRHRIMTLMPLRHVSTWV